MCPVAQVKSRSVFFQLVDFELGTFKVSSHRSMKNSLGEGSELVFNYGWKREVAVRSPRLFSRKNFLSATIEISLKNSYSTVKVPELWVFFVTDKKCAFSWLVTCFFVMESENMPSCHFPVSLRPVFFIQGQNVYENKSGENAILLLSRVQLRKEPFSPSRFLVFVKSPQFSWRKWWRKSLLYFLQEVLPIRGLQPLRKLGSFRFSEAEELFSFLQLVLGDFLILASRLKRRTVGLLWGRKKK